MPVCRIPLNLNGRQLLTLSRHRRLSFALSEKLFGIASKHKSKALKDTCGYYTTVTKHRAARFERNPTHSGVLWPMQTVTHQRQGGSGRCCISPSRGLAVGAMSTAAAAVAAAAQPTMLPQAEWPASAAVVAPRQDEVGLTLACMDAGTLRVGGWAIQSSVATAALKGILREQ